MVRSITNLTVAALVVAALVISSDGLKNPRLESIRRKLSSMGSRAEHSSVRPSATAYAQANSGGYSAPPAPHSAPVYGGYPSQHYVPPVVRVPTYQAPAPPAQIQPPRFRFAGPKHRAPGVTRYSAPGAAAASSAAAAGGAGGAAAASSSAAGASGHHVGRAAAPIAPLKAPKNEHTVEQEYYDEHYVQPETENSYAAQSGTYLNDGRGRESSSYVRATENVEKNEQGKEDEDHYYNANSYGKTYDENKHDAFSNSDEDIMHTPNLFRSKKSSTNYVSDFNKASRESGSGVVAKDRHSASYNKNKKKFKENVDKRYNREGAGVNDAQAFSSAEDHEDEDEERFDSDGLGTFRGVDGQVHRKHPGFVRNLGGAAASGAASSDGKGAGVATSSAAVGQGAAASAAGSANSH